MQFSNVRINYDTEAFRQIKQEDYPGYENTFRYLFDLSGLQSEKIRIEKYLHYFNSRVDRATREVWLAQRHPYLKTLVSIPGLKQAFLSWGIKRFLFWFHGGYTNPWRALALASITVIANYCILFNGLQDGGDLLGTGLTPRDSLAAIFYPIDLLKNVVFKDFVLYLKVWEWDSFKSYLSLWSWKKIALFVFELLLLYSFFCFSATLKKLFGFKLQK